MYIHHLDIDIYLCTYAYYCEIFMRRLTVMTLKSAAAALIKHLPSSAAKLSSVGCAKNIDIFLILFLVILIAMECALATTTDTANRQRRATALIVNYKTILLRLACIFT